MRKSISILAILFLITGCLGTGTDAKPGSIDNQTKETAIPPTTEAPAVSPEIGDVATINYIMRADGKVVDTTVEEVAKTSPETELIRSLHPFGFEPLTFIVGSQHVPPEFTDAVTAMKEGEKRTVRLPENQIGGERKDFLIQTVPRSFTLPKVETFQTHRFKERFGVEPEIGMQIALEYWNSTITYTDNTTTVLTHNPADRSNLEFPGGNITIHFDEPNMTLEFKPRINTTFIANDGRYVTVLSSNETHMTVDHNHPLAGKAVEVEITLKKISDPITWSSDPNEATRKSRADGKPILLLFTNASCPSCRRYEFEVFTNPVTLALKDQFLWAKIDVSAQPEAASKYGADNLPLILFLIDGQERKRITTFLPPNAIRAEMESILAKT